MRFCLQRIAVRLSLAAYLASVWGPAFAQGPSKGEKCDLLARITAFHSVSLKSGKYEARVLEMDGSSSVAMDPIALYVVATNNGTSDLEERVWEIPRHVSKVVSVVPTGCGVDILVDVDQQTEGPLPKPLRHRLEICFLSSGGVLENTFTLSEKSTKAAGGPANLTGR